MYVFEFTYFGFFGNMISSNMSLNKYPAYKKWIELNPMTGIIEAFRYGFLGQGVLTINSFGYSVIFTLVSLLCGVLIFNKTEKTFVDTV